MKTLVTGGAGFIGSHIVDRLIAEGHQVVVLDDLSSGVLENINPQARFVRMSILADEIMELFEREHIDTVFHLAAQTLVQSSLHRPDLDARVNVLGTLQVLEACRRTGVNRIVFASSAAVYGNVVELPVAEETRQQPTSFYGLSKLTAERYIQMYRELHGLSYCILRYANVYGERQGDCGEGGVVSIFSRKMRRREPLTVFGDGMQTRDFIYVGDVAVANVAAMLCREPDRIVNVGTETETTLQQLVAELADIAGEPATVSYEPARMGDIVRSMLRRAAANRYLGWEPKTSLTEGLTRTYQSVPG